MSLEVTGKQQTDKGSGYDQVQIGLSDTHSTGIRNSRSTQESRTDRDFKSVNSTARMSGSKTHIAFGLSFVIKIENRVPFDPSSNC